MWWDITGMDEKKMAEGEGIEPLAISRFPRFWTPQGQYLSGHHPLPEIVMLSLSGCPARSADDQGWDSSLQTWHFP